MKTLNSRTYAPVSIASSDARTKALPLAIGTTGVARPETSLLKTLSVLFKLRIVTLLLFAAVGGAFVAAGGWPGAGQLALLLSYAEEHGYVLSPEHRFIDQAVSGRYLARPGLDRLRDRALLGVFDVLLCLSPDRLARSTGAQQVVLDELGQLGIEVVFLNQPTLGDSAQARLLLNVEGAFAEYERTLISERMRRGRLYRLQQSGGEL